MAAEAKPVKVAVVGSGLAGLTAGWLLSSEGSTAEVQIYESAPDLGMGTHAVSLNTGRGTTVSVDIPPRFVVPPYYTELTQLYKAIGIPFYASSGAGCFQVVGEDNKPYFKFGTLRFLGLSLPYVIPALSVVPYRIVWDLLRFRLWGNGHLTSGGLAGITFGQYLDRNYSTEFAELFAVPMLCVVCTCSPAAVRAYPAETLVEYWQCWALRGRGLQRAMGGTKEVVAHLAERVHKVHLGTRVTGIQPAPGGKAGVVVSDDKGRKETFDHVIIATQAKFAAGLLGGFDPAGADKTLDGLRAAVANVKAESAAMVLHSDAAAMPSSRAAWSAMNVFVSDNRQEVMCTAWQPRIEATASAFEQDSGLPLLQTWNPLAKIEDDLKISTAWFDRPVVTLETQAQLGVITKAQGHRRLWLAGSYTLPGVPLLENAARSGLLVGERIVPGLSRPWETAMGRTGNGGDTIGVLPTVDFVVSTLLILGLPSLLAVLSWLCWWMATSTMTLAGGTAEF